MFERADNTETSVIYVNLEEGVTGDDIIDVHDQEELLGQENETLEKTFINPAQDDKSDEMHQCKMCYFASARKGEIMYHKISNHNLCHICFSSFTFSLSLQKHIRKMQNDQGRLSGPQTEEDLCSLLSISL